MYRERNAEDERYDSLAKNLLIAWIASRLGVTLPTAKRNVEKALSSIPREHPGPMWYHLCEYIEKLDAGHMPFDLDQMVRPEGSDIEDAAEVEPLPAWVQ